MHESKTVAYEPGATLARLRRRHASRRFRVMCLECERKFRTASMLPRCPRCGGSDVEPIGEAD